MNMDYTDSLELTPLARHGNVPMVFGCSNRYAAYLSVCLESLVQHLSPSRNYELNILESDFSAITRQVICDILAPHANVRLRFVDMRPIEQECAPAFDYFRKCFDLPPHANMWSFYTLFIPSLFRRYEKVLALDADIVLNADIAELYDTDMEGRQIAAVLDFSIVHATEVGGKNRGIPLADYIAHTLGIDYRGYFNTGVFLLDAKALHADRFTDRALDMVARTKILYPDQDVFNALCHGRVLYLSPVWNCQEQFFDATYIRSLGELGAWFSPPRPPKLYHYVAKRVIHDLMSEPEVAFWKYARRSPFYEQLLDMRLISLRSATT